MLSNNLLLCIFVFFLKHFDLLAVVTKSDLLLVEGDQGSWVSSYAHVTEKTNEGIFERGAEVSSLNVPLDILTDIVSIVDLRTGVTHDLVALCGCSNI